MTGADVLDAFVRQLEREGLAASTRTRYRWAVGSFVDSFLVWDQVSQTQLERWLDARRLGPRARYWWIATLHRFYDWAIDEQLVDVDPTRRVRRPKLPAAHARPMRLDDVAQVLVALAHGRPERTAIVLMRYAGLRCCEVSRLVWRDVDEAAGELAIHGKGDRHRRVPIGPRLARELPARGAPNGPVIGTPWAPGTVSSRVGRVMRAAGVDATGHRLRHTFATELHRNGVDLLVIQHLLGHASVATTQMYVGVRSAELTAAVALVG